LCFFTDIRLTACKSNVASFNQLLNYFGFTKEERETYRQQLYAASNSFSHFHLHVPSMTLELKKLPFIPLDTKQQQHQSGGSGGGGLELFQGRNMSKKDALVMANAQRFLGEKLVKNSAKAIAIFELIYAHLPKRQIDAKTLTIRLQRKKLNAEGKGATVAISLIEYASVLCDPSRAPSLLIALFHAYIIRYHGIVIPSVYVVNKRFL
jgi:hypothetical protein